jgi:hypothetical protein
MEMSDIQRQTPIEKQIELENRFRESLKDCIEVVIGLSTHCNNLEELISISELALTNNAQLKILMQLIGFK